MFRCLQKYFFFDYLSTEDESSNLLRYESTWQCTVRLESSGSTSLCCSKCKRFRVVEFVVTVMFTVLLLLLLWLFLLGLLLFFFLLFLSFLLLLLLFYLFLFFFYSLYFPCCQQLHYHHHHQNNHQFSTLNLRLLRDKYAVIDHLFS